jgi:penicillin-binding protein 1A
VARRPATRAGHRRKRAVNWSIVAYTKYSVEDVRRQQRRRGRKHNGETSAAWRVLRIVLLLAILALIAGVALAGGVIYALASNMPQLDDLQRRQTKANTIIYDRDGRIIAELHGAENRTIVPSNRIPQVMKDATVAVEDQRFYEHHGVDFTGVVRAMVENLRAGQIVQGGSTITAQLIKNEYLDTEQTYSRKLREAVLSWQLEDKWTKDRILTEYLNTVYYGAGAYGVEAASRTYFHKRAKDLKLKEAALLAALPRFPSQYSPTSDPKLARERRNIVLDTMAAGGYITHERAEKTKQQALGVFKEPLKRNRKAADYFVDYVTRQLIRRYGTGQTFGGGLRVHTSIDLKWQEAAIEAIQGTIGGLDYGGWSPSGALVAVEPKTGYIRAMVGGTDFKKQKFNLAWQARRQAGSAMKTFVLTTAISMGMNPKTTYYVSHSPTIIPMGYGAEPWIVNTYDHGSRGRVSVENATWMSDNTVYAQMVMDTDPANVVRMSKKMGIRSPLSPVPSITLGTEAVNPLEMANAYATLASNGVHHSPQAIVRVVTRKGKVDWRPKVKGNRVLSAGEAYTVTSVLKGVASYGTGSVTGAYFPGPRAGKTGTADDYVDAWYVGYTPEVSVSVWMGYAGDYKHPMPGVAGGTYCAPMWGKFMKAIAGDLKKTDFTPASMSFSTWKGKYSTMSPSASSSASPSPTSTKTVKPTPGPTSTKTIKPTPKPTPTTPKPEPTPTPEPTASDAAANSGGRAAGVALRSGQSGGALVAWLVSLFGGPF